MEIDLPAGTPVAYLDLPGIKRKDAPEERELLIHHKVGYRIQKAWTVQQGRHRVTIEVIVDDEA